jgi:catechol 2,3-dioxygenase-like lactoylglutathione lyase family enzyme
VSATLRNGHIGLNVTDLDRSREFYRRALGYEVVGQSPADTPQARRFAFLGRDGVPLLTLWQQAESGYGAERSGLHHLSFQVDSLDEVRAAEQVLRELGAVFHHDGVVPHREGADSGGVFFEDPDGIRLEIFTATGVAAVDGAEAPSGTAPTCGFF